MTNFKKSVISILLSALLVSTTAIPIFAVEDSDSGVDTTSSEDVFERDEDDDYDPWAESESTDEDSDSDVSEEDIPEVVDEESDETLEPVEESEESEELRE